MKLKTITLTNFRCFHDFSLDLDEQLIVLVARNGAGKTAILDAIAIGLGAFVTRLPKVSGRNFQDNDLRVDSEGQSAPYTQVFLEGDFRTHPYLRHHENFPIETTIQWTRTQRGNKNALLPSNQLGVKNLYRYVDQYIEYERHGSYEFPILAYYGTGRGVFNTPLRRTNFQKDFEKFQAFAHALEGTTNFRRFFEYYYNLENVALRQPDGYESIELQAINRAVEKAMPVEMFQIKNPRIEVKPLRFVVDWIFSDTKLKELRIEQLSAGYKTTLTLVMDLASRMAQVNPEAPDPLQTYGIVLIDEVDLYLHPGWQQTILPSLKRTFPNIQFIVTTHSPQVLTTVPHECIRVIDWENDEPVVKYVGFSEGAEAQQLLNDVLGVDSRPDTPLVRQFYHYFSLVNAGKGKTDEALKIRAELDREWGGNEPKLAKADIRNRLRSRKNGHHEKSE